MRTTKLLVFLLSLTFFSLGYSQCLENRIAKKTKKIILTIERGGPGMPHLYGTKEGVLFLEEKSLHINLNFEQVYRKEPSEKKFERVSLRATLRFLEQIEKQVKENEQALKSGKAPKFYKQEKVSNGENA